VVVGIDFFRRLQLELSALLLPHRSSVRVFANVCEDFGGRVLDGFLVTLLGSSLFSMALIAALPFFSIRSLHNLMRYRLVKISAAVSMPIAISPKLEVSCIFQGRCHETDGDIPRIGIASSTSSIMASIPITISEQSAFAAISNPICSAPASARAFAWSPNLAMIGSLLLSSLS
jgi:hypothetical protein